MPNLVKYLTPDIQSIHTVTKFPLLVIHDLFPNIGRIVVNQESPQVVTFKSRLRKLMATRGDISRGMGEIGMESKEGPCAEYQVLYVKYRITEFYTWN